MNVGDAVTKGQVLAAADDSAAQLAVDAAEANLAAATARLASDKKGPDAATKAAAKDSVTQAKLQLAQAIQNRTDTRRQNSITLSQAKTAVTRARQRLADDKAAEPPVAPATLAADQDAITAAKQSLTATQARVTASNNQLNAQVSSAQLGVTSAQNNYATKIVPATVIQIQSDTAAVANAQASLTSAKTALAGAQLVAPEDGVVTAVNVVAGTMAPSGYAIQLQAGPMIVTGSFTETDIVKLKVGQPATVTVTAAGATVAGAVTQISPVAATTGGSSVVTYAVKVTLTNPPAAVLAGMSASVAVTTAELDNVVTVPASALNGSSGSYTVRVIGSDGQTALVDVQVGLVTSSAAEIKSGITAGETVAIGTVSSRTSTSTTSGGGGTVISVPGGGFGGGGRVP